MRFVLSKYKILFTILVLFSLLLLSGERGYLSDGDSAADSFELLGESKHVKVWGSPFHSYAIKVGRDLQENQNEFAMLSRAYQTLERYDPQKTFRRRATFLKPLHLHVKEDTQESHLITERIYPLEGNSRPILLYLKNEYDAIEKIVNKYPATSSIRNNMEQLCYDLGRLVAILQLGAHIDGYDFEIFLGKSGQESSEYKIVLSDLEKGRDLSRRFQKRQTDKLVASFIRALREKKYAYFPAPSTVGFYHFRQGYLDFAAFLDQETDDDYHVTLANKLFIQYIEKSTHYE